MKIFVEKRKMYAFYHYHEMIFNLFSLAHHLLLFLWGESYVADEFWDLIRGAMAENGHVSYEM